MQSPIGKLRLKQLEHDVKYEPSCESYVDPDNSKIVVKYDDRKFV